MGGGRLRWKLLNNGSEPFSLMKNQQALESLWRTGEGHRWGQVFKAEWWRRLGPPAVRAVGRLLSLLHFFPLAVKSWLLRRLRDIVMTASTYLRNKIWAGRRMFPEKVLILKNFFSAENNLPLFSQSNFSWQWKVIGAQGVSQKLNTKARLWELHPFRKSKIRP